MSASLFSPSWYRVADLRPQLKAHALIHRHAYRRRIWYVLQDRSVERFYRFTPATYFMIGLMNGERTLAAIWNAAVAKLGDAAPTQEETIRLLGQLHVADVLQSNITPDVAELFTRHETHERFKWKQRLSSPLALRFPLFDPEPLLARWAPLARALFTGPVFVLWLAVVAAAAVLAGLHWTELTHNLSDRVLTPQNLLLIGLLYPVIKALHELGHALAVKAWGGEVHETGLMVLVLMPVPYVDASASAAFAAKRQRMIVSAAGMMVEMLLASVALVLWLLLEPGLLRAAMYNVVLIGSVSTLFFNGNPLLRYDGYYLLSDGLEIPNLAVRSRAYLAYLANTYLYGQRDLPSPAMTPSERPWLAFYGIASFVYRLFVLGVITLFIAEQFFVFGILLAAWGIWAQMVWPFLKSIGGVLGGSRHEERRGRAVAVTAALLAGAAALVLVVPAPLTTVAQGVVWLPEAAHVTAGVEGFVRRVAVEPGRAVAPGDVLFELADPALEASVRTLQARVQEFEATYGAIQFTDRAQAQVVREELASAREDLATARERQSRLVVRSPARGTLATAKDRDLADRFVKRGEVLAYVIDSEALAVRAVVGQDRVGLLREGVEQVDVWLADYASDPQPAVIRRGVPAATDQLPSPVLGSTGGGPFAIDPRDPSGLRSIEKIFEYDVTVPALPLTGHVGGRAYIRFRHGSEPVGFQVARAARQLFLGRFGV